ncbi:hypothetical protein SHKM778_87240 [Streptomyces sp. KM77-8]|uniref:Uncharacterized protein n=1 Tax=Streptomyces haneummycinicus TaxID=3074435 RepID=A0AAT9HY70_9ACTN
MITWVQPETGGCPVQSATGGCRVERRSPHAAAPTPDIPAPTGRPGIGDRPDPRRQHLRRQRRPPSGHLPAGAGPSALSRTSAHGPCMITGGDGVQMSEGIPTPAGYTRSTGTVRALTLMIDFSDAPGEGDALDRYREFFPKTREWFATSSYGRLDYRPELPVPDWLRMPKSFHAYGIERGAPSTPATANWSATSWPRPIPRWTSSRTTC